MKPPPTSGRYDARIGTLPADADAVLARGLEFLIVNDEDRILVDYQFFPA
jgi:hypothetical protein